MNIFPNILARTLIQKWIKQIEPLFFIVFVIFCFYWFFCPIRIDGSSMQNTFESNDMIMVSRAASRLSIRRGDIVLCQFRIETEKVQIIKRVIGVPNEHLKISDGKVYIDGELLREDYKKYVETYGNIEIQLGDNEYFVMGDNRKLSQDSRQLGVIHKKNISAKALFKVWPLDGNTVTD